MLHRTSSFLKSSLPIHIAGHDSGTMTSDNRVYLKTRAVQIMEKEELQVSPDNSRKSEAIQDIQFQETHLQEALLSKAAIPTPEVIEIDEGIYDRMYKADREMPKRRVTSGCKKLSETLRGGALNFFLFSLWE